MGPFEQQVEHFGRLTEDVEPLFLKTAMACIPVLKSLGYTSMRMQTYADRAFSIECSLSAASKVRHPAAAETKALLSTKVNRQRKFVTYVDQERTHSLDHTFVFWRSELEFEPAEFWHEQPTLALKFQKEFEKRGDLKKFDRTPLSSLMRGDVFTDGDFSAGRGKEGDYYQVLKQEFPLRAVGLADGEVYKFSNLRMIVTFIEKRAVVGRGYGKLPIGPR